MVEAGAAAAVEVMAVVDSLSLSFLSGDWLLGLFPLPPLLECDENTMAGPRPDSLSVITASSCRCMGTVAAATADNDNTGATEDNEKATARPATAATAVAGAGANDVDDDDDDDDDDNDVADNDDGAVANDR